MRSGWSLLVLTVVLAGLGSMDGVLVAGLAFPLVLVGTLTVAWSWTSATRYAPIARLKRYGDPLQVVQAIELELSSSAAARVGPLWILLTALRPAQEFAAGDAFALPSSLTLDNFVRAFAQGNLGRFLFNSILVTATSDAFICCTVRSI